MTIKHNDEAVLTKKTVKQGLFSWVFGGRRTSLILLPDLDDSWKDTVIIKTNSGSSEVKTAREINSSPICKENGIKWTPLSSKER